MTCHEICQVSEQFFGAVKQVSLQVCHLLSVLANCIHYKTINLISFLCSFSAFSDRLSSPVPNTLLTNTHTHTHTVCTLANRCAIVLYLIWVLASVFFPSQEFFGMPGGFRFLLGISLGELLKMAFCQVIANLFQTSL